MNATLNPLAIYECHLGSVPAPPRDALQSPRGTLDHTLANVQSLPSLPVHLPVRFMPPRDAVQSPRGSFQSHGRTPNGPLGSIHSLRVTTPSSKVMGSKALPPQTPRSVQERIGNLLVHPDVCEQICISMFRAVDKGVGSLTWPEVESLGGQMCSRFGIERPATSRFRSVFLACDEDEDGRLSAPEFARAFEVHLQFTLSWVEEVNRRRAQITEEENRRKAQCQTAAALDWSSALALTEQIHEDKSHVESQDSPTATPCSSERDIITPCSSSECLTIEEDEFATPHRAAPA